MCESRPVMMAHSRAPENRTNGLTGGARRWGMAHVVSHRGTKSASKLAKIQTSMSLFFSIEKRRKSFADEAKGTPYRRAARLMMNRSPVKRVSPMRIPNLADPFRRSKIDHSGTI